MADNAAYCPACNRAVSVGGGAAAAPAQAPAAGLADNVAGALAYVTIIPAIIFLVAAPYNQNRFIKFHSLQCIFLCAASIVLSFGLSMVGGMLSAVSGILGLVILPVDLVVGLGLFVAWILCIIKAYGNQAFKLPVIGNIAASQAGL
jgi:uncharacterized membrane protein